MPVFTAIIAAVSAVSAWIGTLGVVGSFVLKTAVGVGLSLLASAIAGKPKSPDAPSFSVQGKLQAGGDLPRSVLLGWYATAGSLVYANTWGQAGSTPNAYFTQVIALADYPVASLAGVFVNGEKVTLLAAEADPDKGIPVSEYRKDGTDHVWLKFHDGTQGAADAFLTGTVSNPSRPWPATRIGDGVAYCICTALVNDSLFTGFPAFRFELDGARLYDISRDSTAGGAGDQRWDDPATWGGDGDLLPAVQLYNVLRGITWRGQWLYGLQSLSGPRLPAAHWIAQIEKCRAPVDAGGGATEPAWRAGAEVQVNARISDTVTALLTACQGRLAETGGIYKVHLGAPDASVLAFVDGDILSSEEQSFTPFYGLADTINGITASYPSPAQAWNSTTAPPLYSPDFEAADGNRRLLSDVQLNLVPYDAQVQRLMKAALSEARRARRHTQVLPPWAWVLEPGDVVVWTSTRNGYDSKLFRVDGAADKGNLDVLVDITEIDPSDYDWHHDTDFRPVVTGPIGPVRPAPQAIVDWYAEGTVIAGGDGAQRPGIRLAWDGTPPDIDAVLWQVRLASTLAVVHEGNTQNVAAAAAIITQSISRATDYQVRGRYHAASGRDMLWSGWLDVTTPNVRIDNADIVDQAITEAKIVENQRLAQLEDVLKTIAEDIDTLTSTVFGASARRDQLLRQVQVDRQVGDASLSASFGEKITVIVDDQQALAEQQVTLAANYTSLSGSVDARFSSLTLAYTTADTALSARLDTNEASLGDLGATVTSQSSAITTLADGQSALATQLDTVAAVSNAGTASGRVRITAVSAPGGYSASYQMQLSASGPGGSYYGAGITWDLLGDGTSRGRLDAQVLEVGHTDGGGVWHRAAYVDTVHNWLVAENLRITGDAIFPDQISYGGRLATASIEAFNSSVYASTISPNFGIAAGISGGGAHYGVIGSLTITFPDKSADSSAPYQVDFTIGVGGTIFFQALPGQSGIYEDGFRLRRSDGGFTTSNMPIHSGTLGVDGSTSSDGTNPGSYSRNVDVGSDSIPATGGTYTWYLDYYATPGTNITWRRTYLQGVILSMRAIR